MKQPKFKPKKTFDIPESEDLLQRGHLACPGCGAMPMYRLLLRVFGKKTVIVTPASCFAVIDGPVPSSASGVPLLHTAFEASAAFASGVRAGFEMEGEKDIQVVGNAAGAGAVLTLFDSRLRRKARGIARSTAVIDLASSPEFQMTFMNSLNFPEI